MDTLVPGSLATLAEDLARCARMVESWWSHHAGPGAVDAIAGQRLEALVHFARGKSPLIRDRYASLPATGFALADLPILAKTELMADFDAWVTDPAVRRKAVEGFVADRSHIGQRFRDRYLVWRSSGSTGSPGLFLQDPAGNGVELNFEIVG